MGNPTPKMVQPCAMTGWGTTSQLWKNPPGLRVKGSLYLIQPWVFITTKTGSSQVCAVNRGAGYKLQKGTSWLDKKKIYSLCCCKNKWTYALRGGASAILECFKSLIGQDLYRPAWALMLVLINKQSWTGDLEVFLLTSPFATASVIPVVFGCLTHNFCGQDWLCFLHICCVCSSAPVKGHQNSPSWESAVSSWNIFTDLLGAAPVPRGFWMTEYSPVERSTAQTEGKPLAPGEMYPPERRVKLWGGIASSRGALTCVPYSIEPVLTNWLSTENNRAEE